MSWEHEMANLFQESKRYKTDEQLRLVKAVVINQNPLTLASHGGNIIYKAPDLVITKTVEDQIQSYTDEAEDIVGKQILCIGNQEFIAVSFIA